MSETYDLIALGAGPAGESVTELASFFGVRCAIVERNRERGTVTTTGGAPTKTLREAAPFVSGYRDADVYARACSKLIFQRDDRKLSGVHCIGDIASEIVGIGQMAIRCGGTLNTLATMSFNTPTYGYAYKYAALDGLRRLAARGDI